jgi:hypothetical protein
LASDNSNIPDEPDQRKGFLAIPLCALIFRGFSPTAKEEIMLPTHYKITESEPAAHARLAGEAP